jgi:hypothetical protein
MTGIMRRGLAIIAAGSVLTGLGHAQEMTNFQRTRRLAEQGEASAQYKLGFWYANGYGVPENDAEAAKWYRLAAEQGDADAQFNLGVMYANGEGVAKNAVQAFKWFNLAAARGNKIAAEGKESVRKTMTPEQIAEAQRLSAEWKPKQ